MLTFKMPCSVWKRHR